jgi:hypothetical protein
MLRNTIGFIPKAKRIKMTSKIIIEAFSNSIISLGLGGFSIDGKPVIGTWEITFYKCGN